MEIYTIGFTKKKAEELFNLLKERDIEQLVDVRINNMSQLAGFTKRDDFTYFLGQILGTNYLHEPLLAPTDELLKEYRTKIKNIPKSKNLAKIKDMTARREARKRYEEKAWKDYETKFLKLMLEREVESKISQDLFDKRTVLLCSEAGPEKCHRRLVIEYLNQAWGDVQAVHL